MEKVRVFKMSPKLSRKKFLPGVGGTTVGGTGVGGTGVGGTGVGGTGVGGTLNLRRATDIYENDEIYNAINSKKKIPWKLRINISPGVGGTGVGGAFVGESTGPPPNVEESQPLQ